jgi:hypothetical protein
MANNVRVPVGFVDTPIPPCFAEKSPKVIENKGRALQKCAKRVQVGEKK